MQTTATSQHMTANGDGGPSHFYDFMSRISFALYFCHTGSHVLSPNLDFFSSANNGNENGTEPPSSPPQHECVVPESPGIKSALVNGTAPVSPAPSRDSSHDDNELNQALDLGVAPLVGFV